MWPDSANSREASHGTQLSETRRADVPSDHQFRHPICPATFVDTLSGVFGPAVWAGNRVHWKSAAGPVKATVHSVDAVTDDGRHLQGAIAVVQELRLASPELAQAILARHSREPGLGAAFVVDGSPERRAAVEGRRGGSQGAARVSGKARSGAPSLVRAPRRDLQPSEIGIRLHLAPRAHRRLQHQNVSGRNRAGQARPPAVARPAPHLRVVGHPERRSAARADAARRLGQLLNGAAVRAPGAGSLGRGS
jgi:hypothetical protein